jgi:hypothetical protein
VFDLERSKDEPLAGEVTCKAVATGSAFLDNEDGGRGKMGLTYRPQTRPGRQQRQSESTAC